MSLELSLILVALFLVLYAHVWNHQHDRVRPSDIIRRLQKDNRVLTRKLKRMIGVILIVGLFFGSVLYSPQNLGVSDDGLPSLVEPNMIEDFVISADGTESSESLTSFSGTLDDDVMLYPDRPQADDVSKVTSDEISDNFVDTSNWVVSTNTADDYDFSSDGDLLLLGCDCSTSGIGQIAIQWDITNIDMTGWQLIVRYRFNDTSETSKWSSYFAASGTSPSGTMLDETIDWSVQQYSITSGTCMFFTIAITMSGNPTKPIGLYIDWFITTTVPDYNDGSGDGYEDNFSGDSDWTGSGNEAADLYSSDGDVGKFESNWAGGTDYDQWYVVAPMSGDYYFEMRYRTNQSNPLFYIRAHEGATPAGAWVWDWTVAVTGGDWKTIKIFKSGTMGNIIIRSRLTSYNSMLEIDYLGIGPADEMGFSHDGSTTAGFSEHADFDVADSFSSDGDILTASCNWAGGTDYDRFYLLTDTTTTVSTVESTYYPFWELQYSFSSTAFYDAWIRVWSGGSFGSGTSQAIALTKSTSTQTLRFNALQDVGCIEFWITLTSADIDFDIDLIKAYSIANFTISQGNCETDDVLYVDSGKLYCSSLTSDTNEYFLLDHDPAISVNGDTFTVYDIATDMNDDADEFYFYHYVGVTSSGAKDVTRGPTLSGTITDLKIRFNGKTTAASIRYISAIRFIEDGTAPTVVRTNNAPDGPDTSSTVTLSSVVTDPTEVYKVYFDAISYPSGFSDIAYYATEASDNLWTYEFASALDEGYYCFKVVATDGANTNALTSDSYVDFTVEQRSITTYIRIFDSLGDWVPFETFEVYRNSSRQYTDTFSSPTDEAWQIQVKDRFGETLNTTTFTAGTEELVIVVNIHSLKIQSWHEDYVFFNLTRSGITYREVIAPLEIVNFRLYQNTYTWIVDYRNGTTVNGETTLTSSTCIVVTGSTIADVAGYSQTLIDMTTAINITITSTNNQVLTISIDLDNVNTTINNQLIQVLLNITNSNTTIYQQTVDLLAAVQNTNTTLYNQLVQVIVDISSVNSTLYTQTVSILTNLANVNSTLYTQAVSIITNLANVNSTIYAQTLTILTNIAELNATMYLVDDPTHLNPLVLGYSLSDDYCDFTVVTTWHNATLSIHDNDVLRTGPTSELLCPIRYPLLTTAGTHNLSVFIDGGADSFWYNISYTISTVYGEATIKAYYSSGIGIEDIEDRFKIYIDGTRSSDSFYANTSGTYEICIKDFFGNEVYNTSHAWSKFIDIEFDFYTLKIYSQIQNDPIYFVLTRGSSTISEYIGIGEILRYYLASGTYTYTFTQGGQIYTDDLVLTDDSFYTVTDLDLWDIMNKPDNAGGGSSIWTLWSWYGIVGIFGLMFVGQIPNISRLIWSLLSRPKKKKRTMR